MNTIAERIQEKRESLGWSQSELARRMVSAGHATYYQMVVSRTEQGTRIPRLDEAVSLASVLGVGIQWLAYGESGKQTVDYCAGYRDGLLDVRAAISDLEVATA